ncbi:MAG: hypothetical protein PHW11_07635 [Anaerolineaceae bacterium]|jgi:cytochrome b subunit of formate dehydrogenase|nr:hypothetical protein [Anaerolineaceae bacterium]
MEERSCLGCGCGCFSTLLILTILFILLICGLIVWAITGFADGQYQLHLGGALLTAMVPVI